VIGWASGGIIEALDGPDEVINTVTRRPDRHGGSGA
jgi:hypothetical protein